MRKTTIFLALLFSLPLSSAGITHDPHPRHDKYYALATDAYVQENWYDCVHYMQLALESYVNETHTEVACRRICREKAHDAKSIIPFSLSEFEDDVELHHLLAYEKIIQESMCFRKCLKQKRGPYYDHHHKEPVLSEVEHYFRELKPYDYLQLCFFKLNDAQSAASAALTYLIGNPGHEVMTTNLKYYLALPGVSPHLIYNMEAKTYSSLYIAGNDAYSRGDYPSVITYMEKALHHYLEAEEECRLHCDHPILDPPHHSAPILSLIADPFAASLMCMRLCPYKLSNLYGEPQSKFLASFFHYLQVAYYHTNELEKACEATASYLKLNPLDETVKYNRDFYSSLPEVQESYFTPRPEISKYVRRQVAEDKLVHWIKTSAGSGDWSLLTTRYGIRLESRASSSQVRGEATAETSAGEGGRCRAVEVFFPLSS